MSVDAAIAYNDIATLLHAHFRGLVMAIELAGEKLLGQWLDSARQLGKPHEPLRRRAHPRYTAPDDYYIATSQPTTATPTFAKGYNVSASGLGLLSHTPIAADTPVWVKCDQNEGDECWLEAVVAHCTQTVGGYKIGLVFEF